MTRLTSDEADAARNLYDELTKKADADIAEWMARPTG